MKIERLTDIVLALILMTMLFPVMVCAIFLSMISMGFPPFFVATRIGKHGRPFLHVKIRTMRYGPQLGRSYFEENRITALGKILRRFHLDELPELFLILAGTMSFVGPRPLPPRFISKFDTTLRESVLPGWTGLAQIKLLRRGILLGPEQIFLDNLYVRRKNVRYNILIILATIRSFIRRKPPVMDKECNSYRRTFKNEA